MTNCIDDAAADKDDVVVVLTTANVVLGSFDVLFRRSLDAAADNDDKITADGRPLPFCIDSNVTVSPVCSDMPLGTLDSCRKNSRPDAESMTKPNLFAAE